jgi:hypothetical protein
MMYIGHMNRTTLVILTLLSLLPISANAQKGWVRMPEQGWIAEPSVRFLSNSLGFGQENVLDNGYPSEFGAMFYLTTNGGESWVTISNFRGGRSVCNVGYNDYQLNTYRIAGAYLNSQKFHVISTHVLSNCYSEQPSFSSEVWTLNLQTGRSSQKPYEGRGPSVVHELADGTLIGSSEDYMYPEKRGPGTVLHSTDSGNTWKQLLWGEPHEYRWLVASFANKDTGYVGTMFYDNEVKGLGAALRWTTDAGSSWRGDTVPALPWMDIFTGPVYGNNNNWYRWMSNPMEVTTDLGYTWHLADDKPQPAPWKRGYAFYDPSHGYRVTHSDSLHSTIEFTSDSGKTWSSQTEVNGYLTNISAPSERVAYAVGPNGLLYKTTDGGGRFADVASEQARESKLKAWSSGNDIIVENAGDEVQVFDLLGRVLRSGSDGRFDDLQTGMYVVASRGESVKVLIAP